MLEERFSERKLQGFYHISDSMIGSDFRITNFSEGENMALVPGLYGFWPLEDDF